MLIVLSLFEVQNVITMFVCLSRGYISYFASAFDFY